MRQAEPMSETTHPGPDPATVVAWRTLAGLSREDAAALVYVSSHTWRSWEAPPTSARSRRMPLGLWELFCMKTALKASHVA